MFAAFLDANVLVPVTLTDTMLRAAEMGLFRPIWSETVLAEVRAAVARVDPQLAPSRIESRFRAMRPAFPEATARGWEPLVNQISLPDASDRHVAAAWLAGADAIVTNNLRDFPETALEPFGLHAVDADTFLRDMLDLAPEAMIHAIKQQAADTAKPPLSTDDVLIALGRAGAREFVSALRAAGRAAAS
ncbi:MAG: PIN domain-containing protein [Bifidobacteriaceae bacterium]|jgi:predicted nucleic acid-binding protein|nr:PIN domain-containing protein [Bifidobacteriaceae bacterium]